jgi:hypothetical protein
MTDMMKTDGDVIKTDGKGRVRMPADRREELLEEFERSGISGPQFAALVGVKYQTLAGWARKRRQRGQAKVISPVAQVSAARWLEAEVAATPASAPLILQLPCGVRLEVADAKQAVLAARLVQALSQPC